jgi:importin subunit beta-1
MAAIDITQLLQAAQSPDPSVRGQAEASLKHLEQQNLPAFLLSLSTELANNDKPVDARRLAGLILKNTLDAKDENRKVGFFT